MQFKHFLWAGTVSYQESIDVLEKHKNELFHIGGKWTLLLDFSDYEYLLRNLKFSREFGFREQNSKNVSGFLYDVKRINPEDPTKHQWLVRWFFINPDTTN